MTNQRPHLFAMHHSRAARMGSIYPHNMDKMQISHEQSEALGNLCLDIFVDMSNAGATLAETLSAIYMTGVQNTLAITEEQRKVTQ